jgi:integrase
VHVGYIDFLRRTLEVQRAGEGQVEIRSPKYGSERTVYLPGKLMQILSRHLEACGTGADPAAWLFVGERDDPPHQNTVGHKSATTTLNTYSHLWPSAISGYQSPIKR